VGSWSVADGDALLVTLVPIVSGDQAGP